MYSKIKQFLDAAPRALTSANEIYNFARNAYKQAMGVFPDGLDNVFLKRGAAEMQDARNKIVNFPGGKDLTMKTPGGEIPYIESPTQTIIQGGKEVRVKIPKDVKQDVLASDNNVSGNYARGDDKYNADILATDLAERRGFIKEGQDATDMDQRKYSDLYSEAYSYLTKTRFLNRPPRNESGIPTPKKGGLMSTIETEAEMLERMNRQNKETVERIRKRKEKDIDPEDKADGGRIGFGRGGLAGFAGNQMEHGDSTGSFGPGPTFQQPMINTMPQPQLNPMMFNMPMMQKPMMQNPMMPAMMSLKKGGPVNPGRRTFMKTMAGLASLPFVGKLFKPAAKVAETAGPAIAEGVKLGFDKFMMLVDKIKRLGRKTDRVTQTEREVGYTYQGKNGDEYELVEDLTTGDVRITKDKPGVAVYNRGGDDVEGIDVIDDRSTFYLKRNQADETTKGKKPPDEYDEVREIPDEDGTFTDVDEVSDSTVNEILEELGETRTKKAGGGLAYMLGE